MRIAVYHNLPSGGAKRALYEMLRGLSPNHVLDLYSLSCAEHDFCDIRPFARSNHLFPFEPSRMLKSPFGRLNQLLRVRDLVRLEHVQREIAGKIDQANYDLVFVHHCRFGQSPALLKFLQTPSVYYCQEPPRQLHEPRIPRPYHEPGGYRNLLAHIDPLPGLYQRTLDRMDRANVSAAGMVLANSAFSRENIYRTYGISARVNYLGVNCETFRPMNLPASNFVLTVGATHPGKGFDFLIQSLALIPTSKRPPLVIVTNFIEPREHAFLIQLAQEKGVTIDFRLLIPENELVETYNRALLTVYSPVLEPFGFTPLESMACGTAVVGVAEGGLRETIQDGVTGLLADRSPQDFAGKVQSLLNSPTRRAELGRQGRAYISERWTWQSAVRKLENNLSQAAELRKR